MSGFTTGVGELIGGAQREERLGRLIEKISEKHMDIESYQWYLDTRRCVISCEISTKVRLSVCVMLGMEASLMVDMVWDSSG